MGSFLSLSLTSNPLAWSINIAPDVHSSSRLSFALHNFVLVYRGKDVEERDDGEKVFSW